MEVRFQRSELSCLDTVLREARGQEVTQEVRLPEGMPDVAKVLCAWGQCLLRGKEWSGGTASVSGGLMVRVLYQPEDGSPERCLEGWIPFQTRWDLPADCPDGVLRVKCLTRFVDARSVTPRKLMVRAGIGLLAEAFVPASREAAVPEELPEGVELKKHLWPLRVPVEAGEKAFDLEEELRLPPSAPVPETVISCRFDPRVQEKRVVGDKLVFRGSGNLHTLYRSREGQLHSWDHEVPFSVLAELDRAYDTDAQADVTVMPTALEAEADQEGVIRFSGSGTGQYLITDRKLLNLAEDAYSPVRAIQPQSQLLELPVLLENRRENLYGEQTIPGEADAVADTLFLPDFPRQKRTAEGLEVTLPGQFQILYYGSDGTLRAGSGRWEGKWNLPAGEETSLWILPAPGEQPKASANGDQVAVSCPVALELWTWARQAIPMVTGLTMGEPVEKDPDRPSLILRRAGEQDLWDMAKAAGTTVDAIRKANGLTEEPVPGSMLLIPVP